MCGGRGGRGVEGGGASVAAGPLSTPPPPHTHTLSLLPHPQEGACHFCQLGLFAAAVAAERVGLMYVGRKGCGCVGGGGGRWEEMSSRC